jgi:hypothetical protein
VVAVTGDQSGSLVEGGEQALRSAGLSLEVWHGHGDPVAHSWPSRRDAAGRALVDLAAAGRAVAAAREALELEIRIETDRVLAADTTRCAARWGVCPEHGNTLCSSGERTWCARPGCGRTWPQGGPLFAEDGPTARINVRLPEQLKTAVEEAAAQEGRSVNAWLVRAAAAALRHSGRDEHPEQRGGKRTRQGFTGWVH